ncbi:hypothetical protein TSUD_155320 [Trifolium subterraneum]|uniref:Structural maintenance of chromosomes protein 4 n=1 Tax=Trifolium subterraneum TaxID=3900 RepID=A0A2Z6MVU7_TRISU|nr:hypothetical protein TSUD_155320 [Trifolium subterraneum]
MESQPDSAREPTKRPRLFIKEMVMQNFKSYAGEQRVGPFHKSFSAVVGPNGSGKSNVIDAMLFVFGKRAKQMRLNKVSELIHNSSNHQNLDSAGVSVHFQEIVDSEDGTYEAVPGSDFIIKRVAFRDNSSKYYINTRSSNFTEVTKILKGKGVDLDNNRFLILQDVKNEAEAYMLKELSLLKWQEKATKLAVDDTSGKMDELQVGVATLEENLKAERDKIQENKQILKELETKHNNYMKRQEELDNDMRKCKEEFKEFERQDVKYREDFKHMNQKIKKLEDKVQKDSSRIETLVKEGEDSNDMIPKLEDNIPKLQKLLLDEEKVLEEITESSKVETEKFRSELAKLRAELEPWEKDLIEHKGKLEVASSEAKLLNEKHEGANEAFKDAQNQMKSISETIKLKRASISQIKSDIEKSKSEALEAHRVEAECIKEQDALIPLEQDARQKVAELKSVLDSEKSQGSVLKAIMKAKETRQIEGIYGRMGDLGAIDAKFDVAISTACSGLDYIVVETTNAAQACVELLRRENLGVATFMILEKQANHLSNMKKSVSTPEGVPRLFDLVKVQDEKMKLAFFAALRNTVVAKDLDQATRIAYGKNNEFWRVVTLDGALFEQSGTMSGGGSKPKGGKMGTSIRATNVSGEAVAIAEKELSGLTDKLNAIRQRMVDAVKRYQAAEKNIAALDMELAKSQKEVDSLNSQHSYIEKQLGSLEAASKPQENELDRLKELKKIISAEEREINRLTEGSKKLKEKVLELQRNIENAGGEKLKSQKLKVQKIQSDIDKTSSEINRHKVQIETGQKMMKKLTKGIEESKKEKERLTEEKEKLKGNFKEIEQKAFAVQENYKKTQEMIDKHRDVLEEATSEHDKMKKAVDELRASEVDADFKLKDMKKAYKELEIKGKGYRKRLDELQTALSKHLEQIQVDLVDHEKVQATLAEEHLIAACGLKKACETVALLEAQLKEMNPNLDSIAEYRKKVSLYNERVEELNAVTQERDDIKKQYDELRKKRCALTLCFECTATYKLVMITLGGDAELELVDSLDPFSEGVVFSVRPPKKSWKNIANLSGGEKTLSSLALVFALHHYKPTPLYVMDEIDAALDFKNVSIVGHYVKDRTKDAQFIIISLRNNMFELADRLVGIYKTDNCTKSITIDPCSFVVCQKGA